MASIKPGTGSEARQGPSIPFPTPWNQLEAGILFGLGLPLLIIRESGISGGIFDAGVTDVFIHHMPAPGNNEGLNDVFLKWQSLVRQQYYGG
jgi:hypothetical protein